MQDEESMIKTNFSSPFLFLFSFFSVLCSLTQTVYPQAKRPDGGDVATNQGSLTRFLNARPSELSNMFVHIKNGKEQKVILPYFFDQEVFFLQYTY